MIVMFISVELEGLVNLHVYRYQPDLQGGTRDLCGDKGT